MKTVMRSVAGVLVVLSTANLSHAWSDPGHQAVCEIALLELHKSNPAVEAKVKRIISKDDDVNKPFATSCTWADDFAQKNARRIEHFINVDRALEKVTTASCGEAAKCLFTAITDDEKILKNGSGVEQLEALKYLGHWLGDLHQPLHVSYADDRGGNEIPVTKAGGCSELHGTWDRCIPEKVRMDVGATTGATSLGKKLHGKITDEQRTKWRQGTLAEWAEESYAITRDTPTKYCLIDGSTCCYDAGPGKCKNTAGSDKTKQTKRLKPLPNGYEQDEVNVAKEQMQKAGVRLAKILEEQLQ